MCGRYSIYLKDHMTERFQLKGVKAEELQPNYNAAPGQFLPVVVRGEDGNNSLEVMKWGVIPRWAKDMKIGYKLINARSESLFEKPMWRGLIARQRALIPANGFYEWKKLPDGGKTPFFIHPKDQETYAFAGIWETWHDVEGHEIKSFSIITTDANKEMSGVHDRMPVILQPDEEQEYLDKDKVDRSEIEPFLHPYHDGGLDMYEVTDDVNTPKNNAAYLIKPVSA
jgi:putative SOS response-associated peptidase YedK